jgi:TPP-dependent pyruvate/acetoin dehydrogenase alpha subunit
MSDRPTTLTEHTPGAAEADRVSDLGLLRRMVVIRKFEEAVQRLFQRGAVHGTTHLYIGQEAGAVGVCSVLEPGDRVAGTYRGHGHALAKGVEPQALMDEMLGRASGVCGGRAGSMNVIDLEHGLVGCFGIIGGSMAAASGVGLAFARPRTGNVAVAFFGEGTANQGYFLECLNLAQVQRLPVVYVCENNRYIEFTPAEDVTAGDLRDRAEVLGLWTRSVDGMDAWAVRAAAAEAVKHARSGDGPAFLETLTYRYAGHSRSDPATYRKPGELDDMRLRDPLLVARERLLAAGTASAVELDALDAEIERELEQIVERSLEAPFPEPGAASEFSDRQSSP